MQNFGMVNNKYKTMLCKHWETSDYEFYKKQIKI